MKGIICAGGSGSRLSPLTDVTNKHLLPVYNKPMIFYPLFTLINAGITEIMIVCSKEHTGPFQKLLGSGRKYGVNISFKVQDESGGIAEALGLCENFAAGDNVAVILGDNIYEDDFTIVVSKFKKGATFFLKKVPDPQRFGVPVFDNDKIVDIEEKPTVPKSDYAITGFYIYDNSVFDIIKGLNYSARNELEITDVNNFYVTNASVDAHFLSGEWTDAGTFESLYHASTIARQISISGNIERKQAGISREQISITEIDFA